MQPGGFGGSITCVGLLLWFCISLAPVLVPAQTSTDAEQVGVPSTGSPGITETISDIMARAKNLPLQSYLKPAQSDEGRLLPNRKNLEQYLGSPRVSHWPAVPAGPVAESLLVNAQSVGASFLGAQISESGFIPPDSMAAVGPSRY